MDTNNRTQHRIITMAEQDGVPRFDIIMGIILPGIFCVLGIIGNLISLVVLSSDRSRCPTFITLKALAMSDILLLFFALIQQVIPVYILISDCTHEICLNIGYIRLYSWPIICMAQMTSVWLTVLISAERYSAICRPLHTYGLCNLRKVKIAILCLVVFSVAFNIPKFFEFYPVKDVNQSTNLTFITLGDTAMRKDPVYRFLYNTALYCIFVYALPLCIIAVLNVSIVLNMNESRRRWVNLNRQQQRELKATAIPLCIVVVFFVCGTQALIAFILDAIFVHLDQHWLQIFTAVVNLFVIFNSAVNFVIFYFFGSKFRVLLRNKMCCHGHSPGSGRCSPILRRQFSNHYSCDNGRVRSLSYVGSTNRSLSLRKEEESVML